MRTGLLIALLALEVGLITLWSNVFGHHLSPLLLLLTSVAIGTVALFNPADRSNGPTKLSARQSTGLAVTVWAVGTAILLVATSGYFSQDPSRWSDVIPQTMTLAERLVSGETVYEVIDFGGYEMQPTYLPFQFLPFTISVWSGIDPRWIAFGIWSLVGFFYQLWLRKRTGTAFWQVTLGALPFMAIAAFALNVPDSFRLTFEIMIVAFYWLLAMALMSKSFWLLLAGLVLCLLSRYSLVLWLPMFLFVMFTHLSRRRAIQMAVSIVGAIAVVYVLPFLLETPNAFIDGYEYHVKAAQDEWRFAAEGNSRWATLFGGAGMAPWFYDFGAGSPLDRLNALRLTHVILSVIVVVALMAAFYLRKSKWSVGLFGLSSLKIYLAVFYGFIQIPYTYLFMIPVIVSVTIISSSRSPKMG